MVQQPAAFRDGAAVSVLTHGLLDSWHNDSKYKAMYLYSGCNYEELASQWSNSKTTLLQKRFPFHLDDASVHTALSGFLAKKCIIVHDHPLYPPNLAPRGFYFSLKSSSTYQFLFQVCSKRWKENNWTSDTSQKLLLHGKNVKDWI